MKVIHLISGGDTGGAKTHVHLLLKNLSKTVDLTMVCFMRGPFSEEAAALGIRESSAKVLYFRAKEKLTALLRPQLGDAFTEQENDHG